MKNITIFYPISSPKILTNFLKSYYPLINFVANQFKIDLSNKDFIGDHLGLQVLSSKEFDQCHQTLLKFSKLIHDAIIHNRRNRVYRFNTPLNISGFTMPRIEIFEPKPEADLSKLRPGIEHISFTVSNWQELLKTCQQNNVPIDKVVEDKQGKFFKTKFINCIEIEFRNDELGEWKNN